MLGCILTDINTGLAHHFNRAWVDAMWCDAGRSDFNRVTMQMSGPAFCHLTAAGIAGTEKQNFMRHSGNPALIPDKITADFGMTAAAFIRQKIDQIAHGTEIGGIDNRTALAVGANQTGPFQVSDMKGQAGWTDSQFTGDLPGSHAFRTGFHQSLKDAQTHVMRERGEGVDGCQTFHYFK